MNGERARVKDGKQAFARNSGATRTAGWPTIRTPNFMPGASLLP